MNSHATHWLFDLGGDRGETTHRDSSNPERLAERESGHAKWQSRRKQTAWPSKAKRRKVPVDDLADAMNE